MIESARGVTPPGDLASSPFSALDALQPPTNWKNQAGQNYQSRRFNNAARDLSHMKRDSRSHLSIDLNQFDKKDNKQQ